MTLNELKDKINNWNELYDNDADAIVQELESLLLYSDDEEVKSLVRLNLAEIMLYIKSINIDFNIRSAIISTYENWEIFNTEEAYILLEHIKTIDNELKQLLSVIIDFKEEKSTMKADPNEDMPSLKDQLVHACDEFLGNIKEQLVDKYDIVDNPDDYSDDEVEMANQYITNIAKVIRSVQSYKADMTMMLGVVKNHIMIPMYGADEFINLIYIARSIYGDDIFPEQPETPTAISEDGEEIMPVVDTATDTEILNQDGEFARIKTLLAWNRESFASIRDNVRFEEFATAIEKYINDENKSKEVTIEEPTTSLSDVNLEDIDFTIE